MSDDLIKRLREADSYNKKYYALDPLHNEAADRIEQLERAWKDLEKLSIKLLNEKLQGEWREPLENDLADAEAKLQKAVEALRWYADHCMPKYAGEVLAELEAKE